MKMTTSASITSKSPLTEAVAANLVKSSSGILKRLGLKNKSKGIPCTACLLLVLLVGIQAARADTTHSRLLRSLELASQPTSSRRRLAAASFEVGDEVRYTGGDHPKNGEVTAVSDSEPWTYTVKLVNEEVIQLVSANDLKKKKKKPKKTKSVREKFLDHARKQSSFNDISYKEYYIIKANTSAYKRYNENDICIILYQVQREIPSSANVAGLKNLHEQKKTKYVVMCLGQLIKNGEPKLRQNVKYYEIGAKHFSVVKQESDTLEEFYDDTNAVLENQIKQKTLEDHALIMANACNKDKRPPTDAVVKITKTRRNWSGNRITAGQIGVLKSLHPNDNGTYPVKIMLGYKGNLFKNPRYEEVQCSDFKWIQYGPVMKNKVMLESYSDVVSYKPNDEELKDKVKEYLGLGDATDDEQERPKLPTHDPTFSRQKADTLW